MLIINEGELARNAQIVKKLWGTEYILLNNDRYCLKFLKLTPGFRSSVHMHKKKDETFIGISGSARLHFYNPKGESEAVVGIGPGTRKRINAGQYHSFEASSEAWIMEVSTSHKDEDVTRLVESRKLEQ